MLNGKGLRILRRYLDISMVDIASEMFVTKATISNLETGKIKTKSSRRYYELSLKRYISEEDPVFSFLQQFEEE